MLVFVVGSNKLSPEPHIRRTLLVGLTLLHAELAYSEKSAFVCQVISCSSVDVPSRNAEASSFWPLDR